MTCRCQTETGYWRRATCRALTEDEQAIAAAVGYERHRLSYDRDTDSAHRKRMDEDIRVNVLGATAECAYGILFDEPWDMGIDTHAAPDFAPDLEIRCRDGWRNLIIRDNDVRKDRRYVASVFEDDVYRFYGWCWGHEALLFPKTDPTGYGKPARFIPVEALHRLPLSLRHEAL